MAELLDITETMDKLSKLTGLPADSCEQVVAATVDVLHDEMIRRSGSDPTLYCSVQDGSYAFNLGEHLEPSNYLPGDWWTEICRRSRKSYADAEKVINNFRDLWVVSGKLFEPLGGIVNNGRPGDNIWYSVSLRRDFIGPPTPTFEHSHHDHSHDIGGEG